KTITIEAILLGKERLLLKKGLEVLALTSRLLVSAMAPALKITGIPVVSGLTISLDMQITDLRFTQSVQKREALDVSITLQHVPRSSALAIIGEVADMALAAGSGGITGGAAAMAAPRLPGPPI